MEVQLRRQRQHLISIGTSRELTKAAHTIQSKGEVDVWVAAAAAVVVVGTIFLFNL